MNLGLELWCKGGYCRLAAGKEGLGGGVGGGGGVGLSITDSTVLSKGGSKPDSTC